MWTDIAQFGVAGLSIYLMWRLVVNHSVRMTRAFENLEQAIRELIIYLRGTHE